VTVGYINVASPDPDQLEHDIAVQTVRCQTATTREEQQAAFGEVRRLVAMRSPEQIKRMERDRGLLA
jgi:hypothetical protein